MYERIKLAETIESRDYSLTKDSVAYNYFTEKTEGGRIMAVRRFGLTPFRTLPTGTALGFFAFNGQDVAVLIVSGTCRVYINGINVSTANSTGGSYQFCQVNNGAGFFMKNSTNAYHYNGSVLSPMVAANYPTLTVPGCTNIDGYVFVMDTTGVIWNSSINDCTTWNALSFITAYSSDPPVFITQYLNYVVAMMASSTLFFSDAALTPPASPLLPAINATADIGCTSPLSVVQTENTIIWVGGPDQFGRSVYMLNGGIPQVISNTYIDRVLNAATASLMSALYIRIMGHSFYALTIPNLNVTLVYDMLNGRWHLWSTTALATAFPPAGISFVQTLNAINGTYTIVMIIPGHNLSNGDLILVNGGLNGIDTSLLGVVMPYVIDANTLTWTAQQVIVLPVNYNRSPEIWLNNAGGQVAWKNAAGSVVNWLIGTASVLPGGALAVNQVEQNYFSPTYYANTGAGDLLLDHASGVIYQANPIFTSDNGQFIYGAMQTNALDFGNDSIKTYGSAEVIGDKGQEIGMLGYSGNDYQSFGIFRPVQLSSDRSILRRCSKDRRRAWLFVYAGYTSLRFYELGLTFTQQG